VKYFNEVYPPIYIGGERITFDLKILQDNNTAASVTQNYQQLLADPTVDFFFAGFNTANGNRAALVTEPAERLLISSSATSDSYVVGRKHAFSTHPSYDVYVTALSRQSPARKN
jgi:ABC-type branched-subunit amino acid transport system substrate-binding protein